MAEIDVDSFVLRFVQDNAPWYGVIRHVQSSEQVHFTRIEEALSFMSQYVEILPGDIQVDLKKPTSQHPKSKTQNNIKEDNHAFER